MTIETTVGNIQLSEGLIEVTVTFWEASGPTHDCATVDIFIEDRDWILSDLKAEAIQKAKDFLSRAVSSPQS